DVVIAWLLDGHHARRQRADREVEGDLVAPVGELERRVRRVRDLLRLPGDKGDVGADRDSGTASTSLAPVSAPFLRGVQEADDRLQRRRLAPHPRTLHFILSDRPEVPTDRL